MMGKPRLLILTPRFPYPVIGGDRLRIHAICRALARDYRLTLLSLCDKRDDFDNALVTDAIFDRIERIYLPRWRSLIQVVAALPRRLPLQVAYYRSRAFSRRVAALLPDHDLALAHLIRTGDYLVNTTTVPTVLEMTDAISMNYARVRQHGSPGLRGRVYAIEQARLAAYERSMPSAFDALCFVAPGDAEYLWKPAIPTNVVIASNGVDANALPFRDRVANQPIAVFIGNMHSAQNMDACKVFVTEILPLLSPTDLAEFRVVGRIRESDAAWLRHHPRVVVTGEVEFVPEAVEDARFGVCPVRIGAGLQNKVLEYMALGLPVITSPVGHEGIMATHERELLVAGSADEFAARIRDLNSDARLFRLLAENGRRFIENTQGWEASLAPLLQRISALLTI